MNVDILAHYRLIRRIGGRGERFRNFYVILLACLLCYVGIIDFILIDEYGIYSYSLFIVN